MQLPISDYINLPPILHCFQVMDDYWVKFSLPTGGRFTLTPSPRVFPANIQITFPETISLTIFISKVAMHDRIFICLHKTPECNGQTDGQQTESLWLLQRSELRVMPTRCKNYRLSITGKSKQLTNNAIFSSLMYWRSRC